MSSQQGSNSHYPQQYGAPPPLPLHSSQWSSTNPFGADQASPNTNYQPSPDNDFYRAPPGSIASQHTATAPSSSAGPPKLPPRTSQAPPPQLPPRKSSFAPPLTLNAPYGAQSQSAPPPIPPRSTEPANTAFHPPPSSGAPPPPLPSRSNQHFAAPALPAHNSASNLRTNHTTPSYGSPAPNAPSHQAHQSEAAPSLPPRLPQNTSSSLPAPALPGRPSQPPLPSHPQRQTPYQQPSPQLPPQPQNPQFTNSSRSQPPLPSLPPSAPPSNANNYNPPSSQYQPMRDLPPSPAVPTTAPSSNPAPVPTSFAPPIPAASSSASNAPSSHSLPPVPSKEGKSEQEQFEIEVLELTNKERAENGNLPPLVWDSEYAHVAREKSVDQSRHKLMSHDSPIYGGHSDLLKRFGVPYISAGENVAAGQNFPELAMHCWMHSPGHRANILNPDFTHLCVGYDPDGHYWTQHFRKAFHRTENVNADEWERRVFELTNQERAKKKLTILKWDPLLNKVARAKASDMALHGKLSDTSPTMGGMAERYAKFRVLSRGCSENLAQGGSSPEAMFQVWLNSSGQKQNMLNPQWTHMAVGVDVASLYWVQEFIFK